MIEVSSDNFEQNVINSSQPVMIDFWGPQCSSCLALMPKVEALAERYGDKIKLTKVEAPKNRRLCLNLKVMSLPTFLFYNNGQEVERLTGNITFELIENALAKLL
ncbi:MAG: thioredoxin family protein [Thermodesulfobacteriota bacterium]